MAQEGSRKRCGWLRIGDEGEGIQRKDRQEREGGRGKERLESPHVDSYEFYEAGAVRTCFCTLDVFGGGEFGLRSRPAGDSGPYLLGLQLLGPFAPSGSLAIPGLAEDAD